MFGLSVQMLSCFVGYLGDRPNPRPVLWHLEHGARGERTCTTAATANANERRGVESRNYNFHTVARSENTDGGGKKGKPHL